MDTSGLTPRRHLEATEMWKRKQANFLARRRAGATPEEAYAGSRADSRLSNQSSDSLFSSHQSPRHSYVSGHDDRHVTIKTTDADVVIAMGERYPGNADVSQRDWAHHHSMTGVTGAHPLRASTHAHAAASPASASASHHGQPSPRHSHSAAPGHAAHAGAHHSEHGGDEEYHEVYSDITYVGDFARMLEQRLFVDITFQFDDGSVMDAHKAVLCSRAEGFRQRLEAEGAPIDTMVIRDVRHAVFRAMLHFIYSGRIGVTAWDADALCELFELAVDWKLVSLQSACESAIAKRINVDNACSIFAVTDTLGPAANELRTLALQFIIIQFGSIINSASFAELPAELMKEVCTKHQSLVRRAGSPGSKASSPRRSPEHY